MDLEDLLLPSRRRMLAASSGAGRGRSGWARALTGVVLRGVDGPGERPGMARLYACGGIERGRAGAGPERRE